MASLDLENMITLDFSGLSLILYLAYHIANLEGLLVKVLLRSVRMQYHKQSEIVNFVCFAVLVGL